MKRKEHGSSFQLKKLSNTRVFCGPIPVASIFIMSFIILFLLSRNRNSSDKILQTKEVRWMPSFPKLQDTWSWLSSDNNDTTECNFEDFVFGQHADQEDPCLVATFKKKLLISIPPYEEQSHVEPPATNELSTNREKFLWVEKLLIENSPIKSGFFIECGANDGEFISPTIRLEKRYNWTGLLIEANPIPFQTLVKKKRNAWATNVAACIKTYPEQITFYTNPKSTGLSGINERPQYQVTTNTTVQCIPLYTMLKAINVDTIDYLSLDVEGLELAILKTLPWNKINFRVMTIEHVSIPGGQQALKEFLTGKGYKFIKELNDALTRDSLYVHPSLYEKASKLRI